MCDFPSAVATYAEGEGLRMYAVLPLDSHSPVAQRYPASQRGAVKIEWPDKSDVPTLAFGETNTTEAQIVLAEVARIYDTRDKFIKRLWQQCVADGQKVSKADLGDALRNASSGGHTATVKLLLGAGTVSKAYLGWALCNASRNGHTATVRLLLSAGTVSNADLGEALCNASSGGHTATVKLLLGAGTVSKAYLGEALCSTSWHDHATIARLLLAAGAVSKTDLGRALCNALWSGHAATVKVLKQHMEAAP